MTAPQRAAETGLIRKQAIAHNDDYGETTQMSGSATVYTPFLYTGQELDKETGFYHLRARHYAPSLGKFLSRDPIGYAGGTNLYAYVGGDPINFSDPSGLAKTSTLSTTQMNQIDASISEIRNQGFALEADLLSRQNFENGDYLPGNTAGFTDPFSNRIDVKTAGRRPCWEHVYITMLLFHEAQHLKQKFKGGHLAPAGIVGHWLKNPIAKYNLEYPAYSAEHLLGDKWKSTTASNEQARTIDLRVQFANDSAHQLLQDAIGAGMSPLVDEL